MGKRSGNWQVEMASQDKMKEQDEDEESFSYAMQLSNSIVLSMTLQSASELGVFDVLQNAGEAAKLSAKDIASKLSCTNPQASSMLDRVLALLSSYNILNCSVIPHHQRLYSITPVARFFARNSDGVSLGPLMALIQDNIFLHTWLTPSLSLLSCI